MTIEIGAGIELEQGITIGDVPALTVTYLVTENNEFFITENGDYFIEET